MKREDMFTDLSGKLFLFCPRFFFEIVSSYDLVMLKICRIVFPEIGYYPFIRNVGKRTVVPYILHVLLSLPVIWMKEAVISAVEVERIYAELIAEGPVEGWCGLDPPVVEEELRITVEDKGVRLHQLPEPLGGEVVAYIGEAHAAGDAGGTGHSGKHNCLGYAITVAPPDDDARLERLSILQIDPVWVIPDFVPNRIK